MVPRGVVIAVLALAVGLVVGALAFGGDAADPGAPSSSGQRVLFQGNAGERDNEVLQLNGLTVGASCEELGAGDPKLSVWFTTEVDDAMTVTSFGQKVGQRQANYTFPLDDFDRDEVRDLLGKAPNDASGTFLYSRPDGGQVSMNFLADQGTVQGECVFSGIAFSTTGASG